METEKIYNFNKTLNLKHGENSHQKAALYSYEKEINWSLLNGTELTYNDILNASTALEILSEFHDVNAIVIVKHNNPVSVSLAKNLISAWEKILDADTLAPFNGIIAFSKKITIDIAEKLIQLPIQIIIAPEFEEVALNKLVENKNIKIIQINTSLKELLNFNLEQVKFTPFGALIQQKDTQDFNVNTFKVTTNKKPSQSEVEDMIFASKIAKHCKSAAAVIAKDLRTLGICCAQANETSALESAVIKVCDSLKDSIVAIDSPLSIKEDIQVAAQNRIKAIIQPEITAGQDIIKLADKYNIALITTKVEHIKH